MAFGTRNHFKYHPSGGNEHSGEPGPGTSKPVQLNVTATHRIMHIHMWKAHPWPFKDGMERNEESNM